MALQIGGLSASALSLSQIHKLCWARHFELTDSKECWIMGKTADWYSEGASKGLKKVCHNRVWRNFSKFQAFL